MKSIKLKAFSVVASAIAVVGAVAAPQASAAERNLVSFGDSVMADPNGGEYLADRFNPSRVIGENCPTSFNYAKRTGAKIGLPVRDFSCAGAVSMSNGPQIWQQVDAAIGSGALTPDTARVLITTGFNDTYNHPDLNMTQIRQEFTDRTAPQVERIKRAAPNARIQIVGYPTIGSGSHYCLIHVGPAGFDLPAHGPGLRE